MAKLFPVLLHLERVAALDIIDKLEGMPGVAKMDFAFGKNKKKVKFGANGADEPQDRPARGPYKKYQETGRDTLIKMLSGKPPMTARQLADAFEERGRSPKSINSLCHVMKKTGDLVLGEEGYTLSKKIKDRLRHRANKKTRR